MSDELNDRTDIESDIATAMEKFEVPDDPPAPVEAEPATETTESESVTPAESRTRDENGRFAPKKAASTSPAGKPDAPPATTAVGKPDAVAPPIAAASGQPVESLKAPQSFKPEEAQGWEKVPANIQAAFHRRERDFAKQMQESAPVRKAWDEVSKTLQPLVPVLQKDGLPPMQALTQRVKFTETLETAPPEKVAELVIQIARLRGVTVDMLDQAAVRGYDPNAKPVQQAPQPQAQPQQFRDPRLDYFIAQQHARELSEFEKTHEFATNDRIRNLMANALELAAHAKQPLSVEDAYERAILVDGETAQAVAQKKAAERAANAQASTQRAKLASSSVRGSPAAPVKRTDDGSPKDTRADVEAAMAALGNR